MNGLIVQILLVYKFACLILVSYTVFSGGSSIVYKYT